MANYRPVSVLSHDVKILAKIFLLRLHPAIPHLIHPDQTGLKGRYIGESIRRFLDTFEYVHVTQGKAMVLMLDQRKAFDLVSWDFLHKVLEHAGLPPGFRAFIKRLYEAPKAVIKINNHLSDPFDLHSGVKQGCPLSPVLYCFGIEPLSKAMRGNQLIKGITIPPPSKT